jgi:hypothetical protein
MSLNKVEGTQKTQKCRGAACRGLRDYLRGLVYFVVKPYGTIEVAIAQHLAA